MTASKLHTYAKFTEQIFFFSPPGINGISVMKISVLLFLNIPQLNV